MLLLSTHANSAVAMSPIVGRIEDHFFPDYTHGNAKKNDNNRAPDARILYLWSVETNYTVVLTS